MSPLEEPPEILVLDRAIDPAQLARLVGHHFEGMVKYVADLRLKLIAIGGELHADAEEVLLGRGSQQSDLWGANYYPGRGAADCIEYTSLINIRPAIGNRGMYIADPAVRERVRELSFQLIGKGEPL